MRRDPAFTPETATRAIPSTHAGTPVASPRAAAPDTTPDTAPDTVVDRLTEAQALSLALIDDLLATPSEGLDPAINVALARLGEFCGSDRTYIFQQARPETMDNTHEWCAPGIAPMIAMLQDVPIVLAEPWFRAFETEGHVYIEDVLTLPQGDPLRETLEPQGIRSLLAVPMREDGRVVGFMGYDSVTQVRSFLKGEIQLIRSVANIISTRITRRRIEAEITRARALQDQERHRLQATLSALPDLVLELDDTLRITALHANSRVHQPIPPEAMAGLRIDQLFPPHVAALAERIRADLERDDIAMDYSCHLDIGDRKLWYSISAARRPPDVPGGAHGYVAVLRDITERQSQRDQIERLGQIVHNTTNLVITTDTDGRIEWVNPAFEVRTGFTLAEALGHKPGDLLQCPESDRDTIARISAALHRAEPIVAEILNRTKSGERYWVEMNIQPVHNPDGRLTGFMAVQTDTTEHHDQNLRLRQTLAAEETARSRLKAAVDIMQDAFVLFDADQRLVLCNDRFRGLFPAIADVLVPGTPYGTLLQRGIQAGYLARNSADPQAWLAQQVADFTRRHRVSGLLRRDDRWLRHTQMPTPDGGRIGLLSDVTDFKDAELRAQADRARAMDASRDGIALVSAKGTLLYANAAALTLLAIPGPEMVIGQHWLDLLRSTEPAETMRAISEAVAADGAWHGQMQLIRHDGATVDVELSTTRNSDGGALCILRDISSRLRAQVERERLREDLALARRRADLSLLAMGLTHDFNNLLAAISAAATLIEEDGSPLARAMAENIGTAVEQAAGLVRRLMSLGRQNGGKAVIDLRGPLQDAASLISAGLRPPLRLELTLPDDPVPALADATAVMQMALNLCINARDALLQSPPAEGHGRIRLDLSPADAADAARAFDVGTLVPGTTYARIDIIDNGPGMDARTCADVFTPYFSTKGEKGTGLGVPIAVEAVRDHDGALDLVSAPGAGTKFSIFLPLVDDDVTLSTPI